MPKGVWNRPRTYKPVADRFWPKVDRRGPDECWLWMGARRGTGGYGRFGYQGKNCPAHKVAYILAVGPIPDGLWVLHSCDNRPCVNPAHLFLGTHQDNMDDMASKGRRAEGVTHGLCKLSEAVVRNIRTTYAGGGITQRALGKRFGVSHDAVNHIVSRRRWKHVT